MILRIDPRAAEPLYEQVVFAVKNAVARGTARAGDRLPSVRELARDLAINPNTVVRAYELLEREGVIVRRQGAGCFLTGHHSQLSTHERKKQLHDLLARAVTEAFHLGFQAADIEKVMAACLEEVSFPERKEHA